MNHFASPSFWYYYRQLNEDIRNLADKNKVLQLGFSTADAEYPSLNLSSGTLLLTFKDWQERMVKVRFDEVCAVKWQEIGEFWLGEDVYEFQESEWLSAHITEQAAQPTDRHLRINFNACGQLDVICSGFSLEQ